MFHTRFFSISLIVASAASLGSSQGPKCSRHYTVEEGDICNKISAEQGVSSWQLLAVNAGVIDQSCSNLIPGEVICLGLEGQDCTTVHVVQPGDYCALVADNNDITVGDLLAQNPNVNAACTNLEIGSVVCVKPVVNGTITIVPAPTDTTTFTTIGSAITSSSISVTTDSVITSSAVSTSDAVITTSFAISTVDSVITSSAVSTSDAVITTSFAISTVDSVITTSTVSTSDAVFTTSTVSTVDSVVTTSAISTTV